MFGWLLVGVVMVEKFPPSPPYAVMGIGERRYVRGSTTVVCVRWLRVGAPRLPNRFSLMG